MGEPVQPRKGPAPMKEYYELTRDKGGTLSLIEALKYVSGRNEALDAGSGSGRDSLFLLGQGFEHVVALDVNPLGADVLKFVPDDQSDKVDFIEAKFDDYDFGADRFNVINSQFALPFSPPETFNDMFEGLKASLAPGGVFVGTFFGLNDEWNVPGTTMTFHGREQVESLLAGLEILKLEEEDDPNGTTANGTPKHWHRFTVIARRPIHI